MRACWRGCAARFRWRQFHDGPMHRSGWRFSGIRSEFMKWGMCLLLTALLHAETGRDAWLRYAPLDDAVSRQYRGSLPAIVVSLGNSPVLANAQQELTRGIRGMLGRTERIAQPADLPIESAIVLGT